MKHGYRVATSVKEGPYLPLGNAIGAVFPFKGRCGGHDSTPEQLTPGHVCLELHQALSDVDPAVLGEGFAR